MAVIGHSSLPLLTVTYTFAALRPERAMAVIGHSSFLQRLFQVSLSTPPASPPLELLPPASISGFFLFSSLPPPLRSCPDRISQKQPPHDLPRTPPSLSLVSARPFSAASSLTHKRFVLSFCALVSSSFRLPGWPTRVCISSSITFILLYIVYYNVSVYRLLYRLYRLSESV